jgi:hypothetical protein
MMFLLNVFWAQHGSKITTVSNLTYFAVQTPAFSSVQSHLLCCAYTSILYCPKSPTVQTPDCHSVPTHLLYHADIRKLYCPNSPTLLWRYQKTVVSKLTYWVVRTQDYCTVRTLPGCCTWHKRGALCRSLFHIPVAWRRYPNATEEDCRTDRSLWVEEMMKEYCGTPCSLASCWLVDVACSSYHSDVGRQ